MSSRLCPDRVRPCSEEPPRRPAHHVALQVERIADGSVRGEDALSGGGGLEPLHFPSDTCSQPAGKLRPVVDPAKCERAGKPGPKRSVSGLDKQERRLKSQLIFDRASAVLGQKQSTCQHPLGAGQQRAWRAADGFNSISTPHTASEGVALWRRAGKSSAPNVSCSRRSSTPRCRSVMQVLRILAASSDAVVIRSRTAWSISR